MRQLELELPRFIALSKASPTLRIEGRTPSFFQRGPNSTLAH
jgi:hypothetical protein